MGATASGTGSGGISRGRGDAGLGFSGETEGRTDQFEAQTLPDAEWIDPESTGLVGVGVTAPEARPESGGAGLVESQASTGRGAWKRRLAPHHREAVQEFFGGRKGDG